MLSLILLFLLMTFIADVTVVVIVIVNVDVVVFLAAGFVVVVEVALFSSFLRMIRDLDHPTSFPDFHFDPLRLVFVLTSGFARKSLRRSHYCCWCIWW